MSGQIGSMVNKVVIGVITAVIFLIVGVALGPTVIAAAADVNASALSGVALAEVIVLIADYVPAFYYLGLVLGALTMFWAVTKTSSS